eukprot:TRINITY_DN64391_c0_g1_i1.p1 TRINITY_DN64391_c0_g1~~TRINITY_DN64391_c0_g1_i1.p1  ORF type:complete len:154 (-),score=23.30 TRINITY_DN64391_c0_g1_i1:120-581(-)
MRCGESILDAWSWRSSAVRSECPDSITNLCLDEGGALRHRTSCNTASISSFLSHLPKMPLEDAGASSLKKDGKGIICGVSVGDKSNGGGKITCGLPIYNDKSTGAPYVMPLYTQSARSEPASASASSTQAELFEAQASVKLRQEALELLKQFL